MLAIATLLAACGTQQTLTAKPVERRVVAFATLATNACEAETAGPYTALAAARYSAAAKLRAGAITVDAARRVQALATPRAPISTRPAWVASPMRRA